MSKYELTILIKQDITSNAVDKITDKTIKQLEKNEFKFIKKEYWGLRSLEYIILNNRKAHYVMIAIEGMPAGLEGMRSYFKMTSEIMRHMFVKVTAIEEKFSPILQTKIENEKTIDITSESQ